MSERRVTPLLVLLLLATATTGCLGVDNMEDLKARLGAVDETPPPVALATATPLRATAGQTVTFDASDSVDPAGNGLDYTWAFGDGAEAEGVQATHAYARAGAFTATLTVTDSLGRTANTTIDVRVDALDAPPEARLRITDDRGADTSTAEAGQSLRFTAGDSRDPEGGTLTYAWTFGDGASATGVEATHAYDRPGVYLAEVTVRDGAGQTDAASRLLAINYNAEHDGTLSQTETEALHGFPVGDTPPARLTVVLRFDAGVAGTQDLNLAIEDGEGRVVANATTATEPGASGTMEEKIALTTDALAPFGGDEWTARVTLAGGLQVDYALTLTEEY